VRRDFEPWLRASNLDIVCLQEVKVEEDLLTTHWFHGYHGLWNSAVKQGYAGVATLVSEAMAPPPFTRGINYEEGDVEGRVLTAEFDEFELVNVYAPHSHRKLTRVAHKLAFLEALSAFIANRAGGKPLILVGDFNVAHEDIDVANAKANKRNAGFLPEERSWVTSLLAAGFVDAFRLFHKEGGHYTWWSMREGVRERNVGWRLDYIFIEERLAARARDCFHLPQQLGSDHCPVVLDIAL